MKYLKKYILFGLPIIVNIIGFIIFAPLFAPAANPSKTDFQSASLNLAISLIIIEIASVVLVILVLKKNGESVKNVLFGGSRISLPKVKISLLVVMMTFVAGWLYVYAQRQAGIELSFNILNIKEKLVWYLLVPVVASFCEEVLWRGFAQSQSKTGLKSLVGISVSFALIHGIFNPLVLLATFIQGMTWGWLKEKTNSTIIGMALHFVSRYLGLVF